MSENKIKSAVLEKYLRTYRDLIAVEENEGGGVTLSFPFHFASRHRIEITVERAGGRVIVSDSANTIGQLRDAGYKVTTELRERLAQIAKPCDIRIVRNHLVMESSEERLGGDIQRFLEAAKTIGDVYLVHHLRVPNEKQISAEVKEILQERHYIFKEREMVGGEIEGHKMDFYIPPNGTPGLALAVLAAQNTHNVAQVWGFRCDDIKRQPQNKRLRVGVVYDTRGSVWSEESRRILEMRADIAIPGDMVSKELVSILESKGVKPHLG